MCTRSPRLTRPEAAQLSATSATSTLASATAALPAALPSMARPNGWPYLVRVGGQA